MEDHHAPNPEVLTSLDLFPLWRLLLDDKTKRALRGVNHAMREQVDRGVTTLATTSASFDDLAVALSKRPRLKDLTLLGLNNYSMLGPLATASLVALTSLNVREGLGGPHGACDFPAALSSSVAAMLRVIDPTCCASLISIDAVCSCVQLRCLRMPGCVGVRDLSPLAACSQLEEFWMSGNEWVSSLAPLKACSRLQVLDISYCTNLASISAVRSSCSQLEELWMAGNNYVRSLSPLKACTRLRKLDVRGCDIEDYQVDDVQLACPQLADPFPEVQLEGLVLQPGIPASKQEAAIEWLLRIEVVDQVVIANDGVIPAMVQLLGRGSKASVQKAAADALIDFAAGNPEHAMGFVATGAIPLLVQLLGPNCPASVNEAAAHALGMLACVVANQDAAAAAGAIPLLVHLLGPGAVYDPYNAVQPTAALGQLARNHTQEPVNNRRCWRHPCSGAAAVGRLV
ncbi:hypothetical protein FOA52_008405 [Chlamydomonas sp. UWO 241]|nr:hypothetical protein FOA52_008405 [Chlamydomonas sp. UWO 241]